MRGVGATGAVLAAMALGPAAAAQAARAAPDPSAAQIQRAVARAESSRSLWATVNICDTRRYPNTIGIRGQMPALGFASWLSMRVQIDFWSGAARAYLPVPAAVRLVRLGRWTSYLQQGGATFSFPRGTGYLDATVQFLWRREGRLLGEVTRPTTAGHPGADYADPAHYSARQCDIG